MCRIAFDGLFRNINMECTLVDSCLIATSSIYISVWFFLGVSKATTIDLDF